LCSVLGFSVTRENETEVDECNIALTKHLPSILFPFRLLRNMCLITCLWHKFLSNVSLKTLSTFVFFFFYKYIYIYIFYSGRLNPTTFVVA
jgi:hypothetical protein